MKSEKSAFRKKMLEMRDALSPDEISQKSFLIQELLFRLQQFQHASLIMFYVSFRSEVTTLKMIELALSLGKKIVVPAVNLIQEELQTFPIGDLDDLTPGTYGILEPKMRSKPAAPEAIEIVIVPGCAFDLNGFRLGYGVGYYDKFLRQATASISIGLAYEIQVFPEIPHVEPFDMPVDKIVTEKRVIRCQQSRLT